MRVCTTGLEVGCSVWSKKKIENNFPFDESLNDRKGLFIVYLPTNRSQKNHYSKIPENHDQSDDRRKHDFCVDKRRNGDQKMMKNEAK